MVLGADYLNNKKEAHYLFEIKCIAILWAILVIVFLPYWSSFFLGNHDFRFMRYGIPIDAGVFEGRFTQFVVPWLLSSGQILPIWNIFLGFAFYAWAIVRGLLWLGLPKKSFEVVAIGLVIGLNPYILSQLYYVHQILSIFCWFLFCVYGVIWIDEGLRDKWYWKIFFGAVLLFASLGGYVATLELILVLCIGKFWLDFLKQDKVIVRFFLHYMAMAAAILAVLAIYVFTIDMMKENHIISLNMYNVHVLEYDKVIAKMQDMWYRPWEVLWEVFPYNETIFGWCFVIISSIVFVIAALRKKLLWSALCFCALVYSSFCLAYLSINDFFDAYRVHVYSVPFLIAILLVVVFVFKYKLLKNVAFVLIVSLIFLFTYIDYFAQKVWMLGNRQDDFYAERIKKDLLPKIQKDKKYRLVTLGGLYGREKFAGDINNYSMRTYERNRELYRAPMYVTVMFSSGFFLSEAQSPIWGDGMYVGKGVFFGIVPENVEYGKKIDAEIFSRSFGNDKENQLKVLSEMRPFPSPKYYFIGDKDIFLMLPKVLDTRYLLFGVIKSQ